MTANNAHGTNEGNHMLPHHRLHAFHVAKDFLLAVKDAEISDPQLRTETIKSAVSVVMNVCEGAARTSAGEKRRAFGTARGEAAEACGGIEIAAALGLIRPGSDERVIALGSRLCAMLTPLARR